MPVITETPGSGDAMAAVGDPAMDEFEAAADEDEVLYAPDEDC